LTNCSGDCLLPRVSKRSCQMPVGSRNRGRLPLCELFQPSGTSAETLLLSVPKVCTVYVKLSACSAIGPFVVLGVVGVLMDGVLTAPLEVSEVGSRLMANTMPKTATPTVIPANVATSAWCLGVSIRTSASVLGRVLIISHEEGDQDTQTPGAGIFCAFH
jgi:hypothetical protein